MLELGMERRKILNKISNIYAILGITVLLFSIILILIPSIPYIWYSLNPQATDEEISTISKVVLEEEIEPKDENDTFQLPEINTELSKEPYIIIEKIAVNSPLSQSSNYIDALKVGSWMVPEFGNPINNDLPIIVASHRFGYSSWNKEFRDRISFYNLPKTEIGDEITIIWDQREFTYEIYQNEESTYISDYDADLILYTCKYFNSPVRIFRYAKATY